MATGTIFDQFVQQPSSPTGKPPAAPGVSAFPNAAPGPSGPPAPGKTGTIFDNFVTDPNYGTPPPVREPGHFGPYDENSEGHIFLGPFEKGLAESQKDWGLKTAAPTGVADMAGQVWDSLIDGAKQQYRHLAQSFGAKGEVGDPRTAAAVMATPVAMMQSGLEGLLKMPGEATQGIIDAIQHPEPDAEGVTGRQRMGRSIGHLVNFLAQIATMDEGGEFGKAAATGKVGEMLEKRAVNPGNEMVRANREKSYMFGKDPGAYLRDEPVKMPTQMSRLGQMENLRAQNVAHSEALHSKVADLLKTADTVQAIQPSGAVARVPNLYDPMTEIEDAAEEVKNQVKRQAGVTNRAEIARAVNDMRDDILNAHDAEGNVIGARTRAMTPSQINELKKSIGGRANYSVFTDPKEAAKADVIDRFVKKSYNKLNDLTDNAVGGAPGERVRDLNRRYSNAIEFRNLLDKQIALERGTGGANNLIRKQMAGVGLGALALGNPVMQLFGAIEEANRLGRSMPGRVLRAKTMDAAGRALQSPAAGVIAPAAGVAAASAPAVAGASERQREPAFRLLAGEQ